MCRFWGCSNVALQFIYATCKLNFGSWFPFVEFGIPDLEFRPLQSRLHLRLVSAFVRREFAMQVPALSIAWMEQNLNSKKISKGLKRTIGTIQAQAQESWWTSCKKPAHAPDSQKSQDFLELSGKLLAKLHFFSWESWASAGSMPFMLGNLRRVQRGFCEPFECKCRIHAQNQDFQESCWIKYTKPAQAQDFQESGFAW